MTNIDLVDESSFDWIGRGGHPDELIELTVFLLAALRLSPECEVSIALVSPQEMERLHLQWMDEPGPTDVLSFPMDNLRPGNLDESAPLGILGDVIICPDVARVQADAAGHALDVELQMLMAHGVLHLLGYDHAEPPDHAEMFGLQGDLLQRWHAASQRPGSGA